MFSNNATSPCDTSVIQHGTLIRAAKQSSHLKILCASLFSNLTRLQPLTPRRKYRRAKLPTEPRWAFRNKKNWQRNRRPTCFTASKGVIYWWNVQAVKKRQEQQWQKINKENTSHIAPDPKNVLWVIGGHDWGQCGSFSGRSIVHVDGHVYEFVCDMVVCCELLFVHHLPNLNPESVVCAHI